MKLHLTDVTIRQFPHPATGQVKLRDDTLPGFGLIVGKRAKTFFVMYGEQRQVQTIGRYPDISLKDARTEARRLLAHKPQKSGTTRLLDALTAYLSECETKNRPGTVTEYRRLLKALPDKALGDVKRDDLTTATSHHVMAARIFFNWCIRHELVDRNPFAYLPVKYGSRSRVLTTDELRTLWQYDYPPFSDIVKLLILTGQRRGEIAAIQQNWIAGETLTIPGSVAKNHREHTIPLGPLAREYIARAPFSFSGWSKAKARMDRVTGVSGYVIHDIRRTFSTIMAEIGTPVHVTEQLLNHKSGTISGVSAIYNKYNYQREMRNAALSYESHLHGILTRL